MLKKQKKEKEYYLPGEKPWPYFWTWLDENHPIASFVVWTCIYAMQGAAIVMSIIAIISKSR